MRSASEFRRQGNVLDWQRRSRSLATYWNKDLRDRPPRHNNRIPVDVHLRLFLRPRTLCDFEVIALELSITLHFPAVVDAEVPTLACNAGGVSSEATCIEPPSHPLRFTKHLWHFFECVTVPSRRNTGPIHPSGWFAHRWHYNAR